MQSFSLKTLIDYQNHMITSSNISGLLDIKSDFMLYALDKDESISYESSDQIKLILIIEGELEILAQDKIVLRNSEIVSIKAGIFHELRAKSKCKFLQIQE